uniref:Predicted protein n=1 Tax=Hordeum vulgare subsp. vulgare TaxID=112509 RepID=F2EA76_HORVV|nr:predicted protein [Hordeum vulgare subsp. vulgare]
MRMSCNGCRVLRKGCGEGCTIRPCLEWIRSPDAQANATVFLAKFYGRAGLLNLLAAVPDAGLRPPLFRSLLYEACGRMANPVYGSVGMLWSAQWEACQAAVEAVLKGRPIVRVSSDAPLAPCDIRHVAKPDRPAAAGTLPGVSRAGRTRFKRASSSTAKTKSSFSDANKHDDGLDQAPSHEESAGSHVEDGGMAVEQAREEELSEGTEVDAGSHVSQAEHSPAPPVAKDEEAHGDEIGLELTLGIQTVAPRLVVRSPPACFGASSSNAQSSHIGLLLELPVS